MSSDERILYMLQTNPRWADTVLRVVDSYPEFIPYMDRVPVCSNHTMPYEGVTTLFLGLMHYVCSAGVRYDYALAQWRQIRAPLLQNSDLPISTQPKKRPIYAAIWQYMINHNITPDTLVLAHIVDMKTAIKGIGVGCVAWCRRYYSSDDDCVEYTDIMFRKGFKTIYGQASSASEIKKKATEWTENHFGRIGSLFTIECCP